jgi:hypothetical protein
MSYLFVYLLYYVTKWPVNPGAGIASIGHGPPWTIHTGLIPCLLHVYWALHAIHVILAGFAVWSWWRAQRAGLGIGDKFSGIGPLLSPIHRFLPWALLALIFYIPGVYLEWPSDPWEHLRRINEWHLDALVGAHSSWHKSAYFMPYSLLSWCTGLRQLYWLDYYYTGISLLLCWQYYKFSRACGLGERAAMVFVTIQAVLFGNNIFSFYRYYGISSSIYAQLGAVTLTRILLELALRGTKLVPELSHRVQRAATKSTQWESTELRLPTLCLWPLTSGAQRFWHLPSVFWLLATSFCLLLLTAFNHQQGLGIAALGVSAIVVWRLIEWKRSALWWLVGSTLIANALFLWIYPRSAIIETYRTQGYLNAWYGFNILDLTSPAGDRMLQIVSAFGLVNLAAALVLLRRNNVVAWLTITPLLILLLPCVSIPLSELLSNHSDITNIVTFHRMLFACPPYLALSSLGERFTCRPIVTSPMESQLPYGRFAFKITVLSLVTLVITPGSRPWFNRIWHTSAVIANDLTLRDIYPKYEAVQRRQLNKPGTRIITTKAGAALTFSTPETTATWQNRTIGQPSIDAIIAAFDYLGIDSKPGEIPQPSSNWAVRQSNANSSTNLISDSEAKDHTAWITLGGASPVFLDGITDLHTGSTALQNPAGATSLPFTALMIPVQRTKTYRLEIMLKQTLKTDATVYLAVAWYNREGKLLVSDQAQPEGAGNPLGWYNGTYSYFGLISQVPSTTWTHFGISFGWNEPAAIPSHARFLRVGALLNNNGTSSATIQITNLRLFEKAAPAVCEAVPSATSAFSPTSFAATLSAHWPPQQTIVDRGGTQEILAAISTKTHK